MAAWALRLAHPHPHQQIQEKNEIYQRGPKLNLEVDFKYTNFFFGL